jgi:hypothetical protein
MRRNCLPVILNFAATSFVVKDSDFICHLLLCQFPLGAGNVISCIRLHIHPIITGLFVNGEQKNIFFCTFAFLSCHPNTSRKGKVFRNPFGGG